MEETQIKTAVQAEERSVSIKALRVGTKQFTQTLFKQLPEADAVIDCETGLIAGEIWGRVILPQEWEGEREFVLWEIAGHLCRCTLVDAQFAPGGNSYWKQIRADAEYYLIAEALAEKKRATKQEYGRCRALDLEINGEKLQGISVPQEIQEFWKKKESLATVEQRLTETKEYEEKFSQSVARDMTFLNQQKDTLNAEIDELRGIMSVKLLKWFGDTDSFPVPEHVASKMLMSTFVPYWEFQVTWEASRQTILASEQLFLGV